MRPRRWLIVWRRRKPETQHYNVFIGESYVYLRRKNEPWGKFEGWKKSSLPVMVFEEREDALNFVAGLVLTTPDIADQRDIQIVKYV